jgi:hypothetical protein
MLYMEIIPVLFWDPYKTQVHFLDRMLNFGLLNLVTHAVSTGHLKVKWELFCCYNGTLYPLMAVVQGDKKSLSTWLQYKKHAKYF